MAPSTNYKLLGLKIALTVVFISSLTFSPSKSVQVGEDITSNRERSTTTTNNNNMQERKMVLGSRPPGCVNKCLKCRPCMATLVIPPHDQIGRRSAAAAGSTSLFRRPPLFHREDEDTSYYLLSWKCRCGDKLFRP